jgi:hypothetical protein
MPIFESGGHYYSDTLCGENAAFGMFTESSVGMTPIESADYYGLIQKLIEVNSKLNTISAVGYDKGIITAVIEYRGEYEYFSLFGFEFNDITDSLAPMLTSKVTRKTPSSFSNPYKIKKEDLRAAL